MRAASWRDDDDALLQERSNELMRGELQDQLSVLQRRWLAGGLEGVLARFRN